MNAAITAARLGAPGAFLGRVSTDAYGEAIWQHLVESGVDLRFAQRGPEPTAQAIVTVTPVQSFEFRGVDTADTALEPLDVESIDRDVSILHGGTLGIYRGSTATELADLLDSFSGIVSFDPNVRPQIMAADAEQWWRFANRWLGRADLVRGSDEDFDWMGTSPEELLTRGPSVVIRTVGADGVEIHRRGERVLRVPARSVSVVDTVGAGDSFCGALLTQLHRRDVASRGMASLGDDDWMAIGAFAIDVAAITVSRAGANPPWLAELEQHPFD